MNGRRLLAISAASLYGFSRLAVPDLDTDVVSAVLSGQPLGADINYWTQLFPFIFLMAVGMGAVFVAMWVWLLTIGGRIDRDRAAWAEAEARGEAGEQPH